MTTSVKLEIIGSDYTETHEYLVDGDSIFPGFLNIILYVLSTRKAELKGNVDKVRDLLGILNGVRASDHLLGNVAYATSQKDSKPEE